MTFKRTSSITTRQQLMVMFDADSLEEVMNERGTIQTCAGEWRRDGDDWRFYEHEDWV